MPFDHIDSTARATANHSFETAAMLLLARMTASFSSKNLLHGLRGVIKPSFFVNRFFSSAKSPHACTETHGSSAADHHAEVCCRANRYFGVFFCPRPEELYGCKGLTENEFLNGNWDSGALRGSNTLRSPCK